jgi:hypothetical protein
LCHGPPVVGWRFCGATPADQLRERIPCWHASLRIDQADVHWVRAGIRFHGMRHPKGLGSGGLRAFLAWLSSQPLVSASMPLRTRRQAVSAALFWSQQVLGPSLPWMAQMERPRRRFRLPVLFQVGEGRRVLMLVSGAQAVLALPA